MFDVLLSVVSGLVRALLWLFDPMTVVSAFFARFRADDDKPKVPPDPKVVSPAAERALAEAEDRRAKAQNRVD